MVKAILTTLLFIGLQVIIGLVGAVVLNLDNLSKGTVFDSQILTQAENSGALGILLLITNLLIIGAVWGAKLIRRPLLPKQGRAFKPRRIWRGVWFVFLAFLPTSIFVSLTIESFSLSDYMEHQFLSGVHNPLFLLAIVIIGPIAEELVFREGVLRHLIASGWHPAWAAIVSALVFGAVHFNPAQVLGAFLVGLVLAWLYLRTGDVRLPILFHIVNNGFAALYLYLSDGSHKSMSDMMKSAFPSADVLTQTALLGGTLVFMAGLALLCYRAWSHRVPAYPGKAYFED